jgi:hypothetical protein
MSDKKFGHDNPSADFHRNTSVTSAADMSNRANLVPEGAHRQNGAIKVRTATKQTNDTFGDFSSPVDIRPTPLVSMSTSPIRNKLGYIGATYNITLTGAIIGEIDATTEPLNPNAMDSIFKHQRSLEKLFSADKLELEIDHFGDGTILKCFPRLESINFEEGNYYQICRYTINLVADQLFDSENKQVLSSKMSLIGFDEPDEFKNNNLDPLEDFNESWSFDTVDGQGYAMYSGSTETFRPKVFTVSRTLNATGREIYNKGDDTQKPPWEHARDMIHKYHDNTTNLQHMMNNSFLGIANTTHADAPYPDQTDKYTWYNNVRTESIDKGAGSYQLVDQWTLAPTNNRYLEAFNVSISQGNDTNRTKVNIDGTITGLETWTAGKAPRTSGGSSDPDNSEGQTDGDKYDHAEAHFRKITNGGKFDTTSNVYKRANAFLDVNLNGSPNSISLGTNKVTGEITYSVEYDNRPTSYFDSVVYENISVNDTYPGDVYAVIPVLGRPTGPILQYSFGRTEYKRDLSIEFMVDQQHLGYETSSRNGLLYTKPSLTAPYKSQIDNLIGMMSPASEPGIRKYFLNPPQESWNPKEGRYSITCSWTYEISE